MSHVALAHGNFRVNLIHSPVVSKISTGNAEITYMNIVRPEARAIKVRDNVSPSIKFLPSYIPALDIRDFSRYLAHIRRKLDGGF